MAKKDLEALVEEAVKLDLGTAAELGTKSEDDLLAMIAAAKEPTAPEKGKPSAKAKASKAPAKRVKENPKHFDVRDLVEQGRLNRGVK